MPKFHITQQSLPGEGPTSLLQACRNFFGAGHYQHDKRYNCYSLTINSQSKLRELVIPHFRSYPLLGEKRRDFRVFAKILKLLEKKKRGDQSAWKEIADLAPLMNRTSKRHQPLDGGSSFTRDSQFHSQPDLLPILHGFYVSGLTQGDGGFSFSFVKDRAFPVFSVSSHNLSLDSLWSLKQFFGCGNVYASGYRCCHYVVTKLDHLIEIIIPHFEKYPLWDEKMRDFQLFIKGCELLKKKGQDRAIGQRKDNLKELVDLLYFK